MLKASDTPEISKKWVSELPDDVECKDLEKALGNAEKALTVADKKGDPESIEECLAALASLGTAANKTIKKCNSKKHKEVIAVLAKFEDLIDEEVSRLEEAKAAAAEEAKDDDNEGDEDEDDEDAKGVFKEEYLARMIKQLRSGAELNFTFGLDKSTPEDSRLVLCNKRKPERLHKMLKRKGEFKNRLITFGRAIADGKTIEFHLAEDAKEPSQIVKLAKLFLKGNRELRFKKIRVHCGGRSFEDIMDELEDQAEGGDLQQRLRGAAAAANVWKKSREGAGDDIAQLRKALSGFDEPEVASIRERLVELLDGYPDLELDNLASAGDQDSYDHCLEKTRRGMEEWRKILSDDPALRAIDENPFGVNTNLVSRFEEALDEIESSLKA